MSRKAIVLAHGEQARLAGVLSCPKQLLDLTEYETILARTVRIFEGYVDEVVVFAPSGPDWEAAIARPHNTARIKPIPHPGGSTLHGLQQTRPLWGQTDQTIVLLGDVVYSTYARDALVSATGFTFVSRYGENLWTMKSWGEVFGFSFPRGDADFLNQMLSDTHWCTSRGKLFDLVSFMRMRGEKRFLAVDLVNDYTDDIDTPEDLEVVLPRLRELARAD